MRILIVNTSEQDGGAAVAANRLVAALNNNGVQATMLVRDRSTENPSVTSLKGKCVARWRFLWDRLRIFLALGLKKDHLWDIDIACAGTDITSLPEFKDADVIHLSWINHGMLSLMDIDKIVGSGKPVVWTMHDLWPATAICHYARGCRNFISGCRNCRLLPGGGGRHDLSYKVWNRKKRLYLKSDIHFVTCSNWLGIQAKQSALLQGMNVTSIPNPIDTRIFNSRDRQEAKTALGLPADKKVVLFVAQKVTDERKGAQFLVDALNQLSASNKALAEECVVALLGGRADELTARIDIPSYPLGYVYGDKNIARIYNAADVFVIPSMEDNLPNTVMEAMACGVPCVGFNVGGIPEMIDHTQNGYVANAGSTVDLCHGICWTLFEADYAALQDSCLAKVARCYSQESVAQRYTEVYNRALAQKGHGQ